MASASEPGVGTPARPPDGPPLRDTLRREAGDGRRDGVVRPEDFDSTLYFLDQKEIEYLKAAIDQEYSRNPAHGAISLLFETVEACAEPDVRAEALDALGGLLPLLLGAGQFEEVTHLISEARRVSQSPGLDAGEKTTLDRLRLCVSDLPALAQLFHALQDGGVQATPEAICILMRELSPDAIRRVLVWPDQMSNREASANVSRAIDAFFEEWPLALGRMLGTSDRAVVHAALGVAARGRHPDFAEAVAAVGRDADPTTRARVAEALTAIGTPASLRLLSRMASDSDTEVRATVFTAFAARPYRSALSMLESALSAGDLEQRSEREKRALFEAYGASAGPEGIAVLEPILRGRVRTGQRASPHTRACAALALGRIGTPRARAVLGEASGDRDPLVRSAASSALRNTA